MSGVHVRLRVGGEAYALAVENVLEVAELREIAPVPGAPARVLGVSNLRGEVLPVFDLANVLGLDRERPPQRLVIAEHDGRRAGFAVDGVVDVGELAEPDEEAGSDFLRGATLEAGQLVGVVDVGRVFDALARDDM